MFDVQGTLGISRDVPVGVQDIHIVAVLQTDADDATLAKLAELTERYCVVAQTLAQRALDHRQARGRLIHMLEGASHDLTTLSPPARLATCTQRQPRSSSLDARTHAVARRPSSASPAEGPFHLEHSSCRKQGPRWMHTRRRTDDDGTGHRNGVWISWTTSLSR